MELELPPEAGVAGTLPLPDGDTGDAAALAAALAEGERP